MSNSHIQESLCCRPVLNQPGFPTTPVGQPTPSSRNHTQSTQSGPNQPPSVRIRNLFGKIDYNKNPLMPPGIKVVVHEKPHQQGSWEPHGKLGWYLGLALEHYRCHRCHIIETNSERMDTAEFFPHERGVTKITTQEAAVIAPESLVQAMKQSKPPKNLAILLDPTKAAIQQLQQIIHPSITVKASTAELPRVRSTPRVDSTKSVETNEPIAKRTRNAGIRPDPLNFYANAVTHPITGRPMEYHQLISDPSTREAWKLSAANEFGRLAQGVGSRVKGTNTIHFILHHECQLIDRPLTQDSSARNAHKNKRKTEQE
jgi:hypothetical protein